MRVIDYYNILAAILLSGITAYAVLQGVKAGPKEKRGMDRKVLYAAAAVSILAGCVLRLIWSARVPAGMHQDEASIGYEAYILAKYGVDRYGNPWPVYPITYGVGGGSPLLIYLNVIAVKLFGPDLAVERRICALSGCIGLPLFGLLFCNDEGKGTRRRTALFSAAVFILAVMPWHIQMSRWGLDSNTMPMWELLAALAFIWAVRNGRKAAYFAAGIVNGICLYAYGSANIIIPLFLVLAAAALLYTKRVSFPQILCGAAGLIVCCMPLFLFYAVNYLGLPEIRLPFTTFNRFTGNRLTRVFVLGSGNTGAYLLKNCIILLKNLTIGYDDHQDINCLPWYACTYRFTFPLVLTGLVLTFRSVAAGFRAKDFRDRMSDLVVAALFIASALFSLALNPTINRMIMLYIPISAFMARGLVFVYAQRKILGHAAVLLILVGAVSFAHDYFFRYNTMVEERIAFMPGFADACSYADEVMKDRGKEGNVYCTYENVVSLYLIRMYQSKMSPEEYQAGVVYDTRPLEFRNAVVLGNYVFDIPDDIRSQSLDAEEITEKYADDAFIINDWEAYLFPEGPFDFSTYDAFTVVTVRQE